MTERTEQDVEGLLERIDSMVAGDYSEESEDGIEFTVCQQCGGSPAQHYEDPPCTTGTLHDAAAEIRRLRSEVEALQEALDADTEQIMGFRAALEQRDAALREALDALRDWEQNVGFLAAHGFRVFPATAEDIARRALATGGDDVG